MKKVLIYLDTNKVVNPFDPLLALDADYDAVLPYANISEDNVDYIVHNSIFARGSEGMRNTVFMVGGSMNDSEKVFRKLRRMLREPFKMSVIWDPNGACTTAASMVAKIEKHLGSLKGKKAIVLAGTGPIGQISAMLLRNLGAEVTITSRTKDKANKIAHGLCDDVRGKVHGVAGSTSLERFDACKDAEIIIATGAIGTQLLDAEGLGKLNPELVADVNAVQPYGIEDMKADMDGEEVNGCKRLGPCTIGDLKNLVEKELLKKAVEETNFYDYNDCLVLARDLLR